jgi:hypothetical protein
LALCAGAVDNAAATRWIIEVQKLVFSFALTILAAFSISTCCVEAQTVWLDAVLKDCEQRTIVMGRAEDGNMVKVGERIKRLL